MYAYLAPWFGWHPSFYSDTPPRLYASSIPCSDRIPVCAALLLGTLKVVLAPVVVLQFNYLKSLIHCCSHLRTWCFCLAHSPHSLTLQSSTATGSLSTPTDMSLSDCLCLAQRLVIALATSYLLSFSLVRNTFV